MSELVKKRKRRHPANFLWPYEDGSVEEAGYEFVNGKTEPYRKLWWKELKRRIIDQHNSKVKTALRLHLDFLKSLPDGWLGNTSGDIRLLHNAYIASIQAGMIPKRLAKTTHHLPPDPSTKNTIRERYE